MVAAKMAMTMMLFDGRMKVLLSALRLAPLLDGRSFLA